VHLDLKILEKMASRCLQHTDGSSPHRCPALSGTSLARSAESHPVTRAGNLLSTGDAAYVTGYLMGRSLDSSPCPLPPTAYIQSYILN